MVASVLAYAHRHNVTKIMAGKPKTSRWIELLRSSMVDRLIRLSGNIDVYVISSEAEPQTLKIAEGWRPHRPLGRYLMGLLLVAAATGLSALIDPYISPTNLVVIYLLAVVLAAVYLGRGPSILTSILGVAAFDYFLCTTPFNPGGRRWRILADVYRTAGGRFGDQPVDRPGARTG